MRNLALPRAFTPLVALSLARLRAAKGVRFGAGAAVFVFAFVAVAMFIVRSVDGDRAAFDGVVASAGPWALWLAGGAAALAAAHGRPASDRRDGIDSLAASRGADGSALGWARAVAAALTVAALVGAPLVTLALLAIVLAGTASAAWHALGHLVGAALFAIVSGLVLGFLAELCGRARYGRAWLVGIALGTWAFAAMIGAPSLSLPGGLYALLHALGQLGGVSS